MKLQRKKYLFLISMAILILNARTTIIAQAFFNHGYQIAHVGEYPEDIVRYGMLTPEDSVLLAKRHFTYNKNGLLVEMNLDTIFHIFDLIPRTYNPVDQKYYYDEKDRLVGITETKDSYYSDTTFIFYQYNANDQLIKYQSISPTEELTEEYSWENGQLIRSETHEKTCFNMTMINRKTSCMEWNKPVITETDYNAGGLPVEGRVISDDTAFVFYTYNLNESGIPEYTRIETHEPRSIKVDSMVVRDTLDNFIFRETMSRRYDLPTKRVLYKMGDRSMEEYDMEGKRISGSYYNWNYQIDEFELEVLDTLKYDEEGRIIRKYSLGTGGSFSGDEHLLTFRYYPTGDLKLETRWNKSYFNEWVPYRKDYYTYINTEVNVANPQPAIPAYLCYPNPATDRLYIQAGREVSSGWDYKLIDQSGRIVRTGTLFHQGLLLLDISTLSNGTYHLLFSDSSEQHTGSATFIKVTN